MIKRYLLGLALTGVFLIIPLVSFANPLPKLVELDVPQTILRVNGKASPGAFVTIKSGENVIGTTTANSSADFSHDIVRNPGIHNISVFYDDIQSTRSKPISANVSVQSQQVTNLNVLLPPTIKRITPSPVVQGSLVQVRGFSVPSSLIDLSLDFGQQTFQTTTGSDGSYEFLINTAGLNLSNHTARTNVTVGGTKSEYSNLIDFNIQREDGNQDNNFVVGPDQLPSPFVSTPDDGAVIDGDSVLIEGEAQPGAQINIYQDGEFIGSVFADENGDWEFVFTATYTPVTLTFEACFDGTCSVLSDSITLHFKIDKQCSHDIRFAEYRFWDVEINSEIQLIIDESSGEGIVEINWGDNINEKFDFDSSSPPLFTHRYSESGNFNGKVTYFSGECEVIRYFSVSVNENLASFNLQNLILVIVSLIVLAALMVWYLLSRTKHSSEISS